MISPIKVKHKNHLTGKHSLKCIKIACSMKKYKSWAQVKINLVWFTTLVQLRCEVAKIFKVWRMPKTTELKHSNKRKRNLKKTVVMVSFKAILSSITSRVIIVSKSEAILLIVMRSLKSSVKDLLHRSFNVEITNRQRRKNLLLK